MSLNRLEVVLKITERCNINCNYCYMFNLGNEDYKSRPVYMHQTTIDQVATFIANGAQELNIQTVIIILHGGEPLLLKKDRFEKMCLTLQKKISPFAKVRFTLQTNAILIDHEWIRLFTRFRIGVGVSLDGPAEYNDIGRLDHAGKTTFEDTLRGLRQLQQAAARDLIPQPGILTVINPANDARKLYRFFIDELHIRHLDFLLPIVSHETFDHTQLTACGDYLLALVDEHFREDKTGIELRLVDQFVEFLNAGANNKQKRNAEPDFALIVISGDGELGPDDDMKPLNFCQNVANVRDITLAGFLNRPEMIYIQRITHSIPDDCQDCAWQNYCKGGAGYGVLINRYSAKTGFNNKSVLCDALKDFHLEIVKRLMALGLTDDQLDGALDFDEDAYEKAADIAVPPGLRPPMPTIPIIALMQSA
jgi:uncharacterized protein